MRSRRLGRKVQIQARAAGVKCDGRGKQMSFQTATALRGGWEEGKVCFGMEERTRGAVRKS